MTGIRRTLTVAVLATVGALAFALSVVALSIDLFDSVRADGARSIGVTYTFEQEKCAEGTPDFRDCRWEGTIRDGNAVLATNVRYVDSLPADVTPGKEINALWSSLDPTQAWSVETSRAWLNSIGALVVSAVMLVGLGITAVVWWRRYGRESKDNRLESARLRDAQQQRADRTAKAKQAEVRQ